jgi:micrococcal nuclease
MGIDTPESRTRDLEEKKFGLAAKKRLIGLLGKSAVLATQVNKNGEDMKGKFGRILGDFNVYDPTTDSWRKSGEVLISEGHAVEYLGQNKEDIQEAHLINRKKLLESGIVHP